ncbi:hypothetical protein SAMN02745146_2955 [Hymenobacter daecheongensis DSM 21074]|uniref:SpoIIAA-like n=1 Tax=Hymenobacter daecheongensis DSM 21074 TaxID=1121955 RepID=A0A1M6ISB8_9BACT|nr:hypothetical protein [Hymenobacter daecheongensis]SHJ37383.1 hypothetical protein SAMN02745146_2955 [Hymenobacter daecheongensis DSM 21074]
MNLHPLVNTESLFIAYDQDNDWLYADWKGIHTQASAQAGCEQILQCLKLRPCRKILNDNSNVFRAEFRLTGWGLSWLHELGSLGLECLAWVYAPDFKARQDAEALLPLITQPVLATFDDLASACWWLQHYQSPGTIMQEG